MDVVYTKVLVLVFLAIIKLGSGLLPVLLDKVLQVKKVIYIYSRRISYMKFDKIFNIEH